MKVHDIYPTDGVALKNHMHSPLGMIGNGVSAAMHVAESAAMHVLTEKDSADEMKAQNVVVRLDSQKFRGIRDDMTTQAAKDNLYDIAMRVLVPVAIIANAAIMGYSADYGGQFWTEVLEQAFTALFALEMFVALYREGFCGYFSDSWRYFDFLLAWLAILDSWVLSQFDMKDGPLSAFLVLRVFRVLRIVRLLRLLKLKKELMMMAAGVLSSIKTTCWMAVLLVIVVFTGALFIESAVDLEAYGHHEDFAVELYFGSLSRSMMTMFNVMVLDGWADLIWPVFETQPLLVFFFMAFLMFTTFGSLNVVIGLVTEQAMAVSEAHEEIELEKKRRLHMQGIITLADNLFQNHDELSSTQLSQLALSREDLLAELRQVAFPRGFGMDDLHSMFDDAFSGTLSKEEFINGMFRLVFNDEFQRDCCMTLQIARLRQQIHENFQQLTKEMHACLHGCGQGELHHYYERAATALPDTPPFPRGSSIRSVDMPMRSFVQHQEMPPEAHTPRGDDQTSLRNLQCELNALCSVPFELKALKASIQELALHELRASQEGLSDMTVLRGSLEVMQRQIQHGFTRLELVGELGQQQRQRGMLPRLQSVALPPPARVDALRSRSLGANSFSQVDNAGQRRAPWTGMV